MPEGLEAEIWRRAAAPLVGRRIISAWCDERVAPAGLGDALVGATVSDVHRLGKVVQLGTSAGLLGLHFGMTGRLEVDGNAPIKRLEYASAADRPEWDRLRIFTEPGAATTRSRDAERPPALRLNDPRRLGRVSLDEVIRVGPDLLTLTAAELAAAFAGRRAAVKTLLLDQQLVAGLGNLCADEVLFDAGVAPGRAVDELGVVELETIAQSCRRRLPEMLAAGGSTSGVLSPEIRGVLLICPRDGAPLERARIGGRTAVWCPVHQR